LKQEALDRLAEMKRDPEFRKLVHVLDKQLQCQRELSTADIRRVAEKVS
jgi:Mg/Co/Ni transporter MgtE